MHLSNAYHTRAARYQRLTMLSKMKWLTLKLSEPPV